MENFIKAFEIDLAQHHVFQSADDAQTKKTCHIFSWHSNLGYYLHSVVC